MKKRLKCIMYVTICIICIGCIVLSVNTVHGADTSIEKALNWAVEIANDDSHGYSQQNRNGPDYDCSSLVINALKYAGMQTGNASYTGNMRQNLTGNGFEWIPWNQISNSSNLQRGDILLNEAYHTAFYLGNGKVVEAHGRSAADKNSGGYAITGDQDGQEIRVTSYYLYSGGWNGVLRYKTSNPPTNPQISMNKGWYDLSDTIEVTAHADNATDYWISMYKDGQQIVNGERAENGKFTIPASQHGIGLYSCYFSCSNSAGSVDTAWINNLSVVGAPSYTDIWTSKGIYDLDEKVIINVLPICARGQIVGIDKVGSGRVVTEDCGESYQIEASQLGEGTYWTYFAIYNGSEIIGTKYVTFKITNRCNLGDSFYAKIKNSTSNLYIANVQGNVEGISESCNKSQIWNFQRQGDGSYKIISTLDQNAMDAKNYGNAGGGTNLQMNTSWDTTAQKFKIYEAYDALYFEPVCCDMFMDLTGSGNVELWGGGGDYASQKFKIEKVDSTTIEHKYTSTITKESTCTEEGIETHTCSVCGDSYTSKIEKKPHNYSTEWTTDTLPTTTTEGSKSHHCTVCGAKTDITAIPKLDIIPQGGVFSIIDASGRVDEIVDVYINVENNPGIVGATLGVAYDTDKLQLISCEDQGVLNDYQWSELNHQPFLMNWEDPLATVNNTANGNIAKLQFKILKDLGEDGAELKLTIDTAYDVDINDVLFTAKSGKITMSKYKPGDMNDDGVINSKDSILLRKYVLGGSGVINKDAADVNHDGVVNSKDSILLRKYVLGGSVELK